MKTLIKIDNLTFAYDKTKVLENIFLEIKQNDFLAIIGPNGGGKTTLLKLILKILPSKKNSISYNIDESSIAYVPQNTNLNLQFPITALEVVLMGHKIKKRKLFGYSEVDKDCAMHSLTQVNMQAFANRKIGDLSGGQRQRVFIARALCSHPKILFLDEPTASIDVKGQQDVYDLLKELNSDMSIIVISHDISVLLNYAKNVAHVNKNLVFHSLDNISSDLEKKTGHMCEVELLSALGNHHSACCNHDHKDDKC